MAVAEALTPGNAKKEKDTASVSPALSTPLMGRMSKSWSAGGLGWRKACKVSGHRQMSWPKATAGALCVRHTCNAPGSKASQAGLHGLKLLAGELPVNNGNVFNQRLKSPAASV